MVNYKQVCGNSLQKQKGLRDGSPKHCHLQEQERIPGYGTGRKAQNLLQEMELHLLTTHLALFNLLPQKAYLSQV